MTLEQIIKEAKSKFDEKWVNYKPPADDPYKSGIWSGGDYYQIKSFLTEQIKLAYEKGENDALGEVKESDSIENMFALLEKEKCNPKYIKVDDVGFSRWIEFMTEYQTCWIEWYKNISTLRVGDMYGVRIPFTHIQVNTHSPANKRCLSFVNGQAQPKFGLADIDTDLTLKKLEWQ